MTASTRPMASSDSEMSNDARSWLRGLDGWMATTGTPEAPVLIFLAAPEDSSACALPVVRWSRRAVSSGL